MDLVGGFLIGDGSRAKALTGVDDHSRFCVLARLMRRERTQPGCDGLSAAMSAYGVPQQILTDNGRVFTGRFFAPPVEVLFDRICAGVRGGAPADAAAVTDDDGEDRAVPPDVTGRVRHHPTFKTLRVAQQALDEWVGYYNTQRPHQGVGDQTPESR